MEIIKKQTLSETFSVYFDKRMIRILLLGIISGFPWVIIGSSLSLWLKEDGLSRSTIGWAGLIFGVYAVNYLWAPIIDRIRIPWLTSKIGHRRGWIVTMQFIILVSLVCWSVVDPTVNLGLVITIGLIIAIASATQDITVDALRIEQIGENEGRSMQAGAAMAVVGWWTGYKLGGVIALNAAAYFQNAGFENYWQITFLILGIVVIACNIGLMFVHESQPTEREMNQRYTDQIIEEKLGSSGVLIKIAAWLSGTIAGPVLSFFKRNGFKIALYILGFVFLFKIGEAFLGRMSIIFYKEIGFSKGDIALYSKGIGWITTVVFTLLGGLFAIRSGVVKAMFVSGILMAGTNLLFAALATSGKSEWLFAVAVLLDDIAAAFATVAFVAFISLLVDRTYTATQYALLASIGTLGRTTLAGSSGWMVDTLEKGTDLILFSRFSLSIPSVENPWAIFFVITSVMVIPSLILLWFIRNKLKIQ
jgi:MFS transporter, PAT family, beta-lactamase induction signal transducer AmpG